MRYFLISLLLSALSSAAVTPREAAGIHYPYPTPALQPLKVPAGYTPFYISHFGRHGSRYLIGAKEYAEPLTILSKADSANALTPFGKSLLRRVKALYTETDGHFGELTRLGRLQHNGIARRMVSNYPEVFSKKARINARSTLAGRCVSSMQSFLEALADAAPELNITSASADSITGLFYYYSPEGQKYRSQDAPWRELFKDYSRRHMPSASVSARIFSDREYLDKEVDADLLAMRLYYLVTDAPNVDSAVDLSDVLTAAELQALWNIYNTRLYVAHSNFALSDSAMLQSKRRLLRDIIDRADAAIAGGGNRADLRFGHDENLVPLTALMGLKGCDARIEDISKVSEAFRDYEITPMAANLQLIFYRSREPDKPVLVKFMLNERETRLPIKAVSGPYYDWAKAREFLLRR